ncbi:MAG: GAF domain-containing protein [Acidobacteria bacterium]|nr:GAF domain-containing protein [Acidobacteriota bacterium]
MTGAPERRVQKANPSGTPQGTDPETPPEGRPHVDALTALRRDRERLRLLDERRRSWSDAALETSSTLLRGVEDDPLDSVVSRLLVLAGADEVTLVRAFDGLGPVRVVAIAGSKNTSVVGDIVSVDVGSIEAVLRAGQPHLELGARSAAPRDTARGSKMVVPMRSADRVIGAVVVIRCAGSPPFDETDLDFLSTFVDHATVAIELAEARVHRERSALLEERARIARDLHDTAIQQLFAAGLELRATAAAMDPGATTVGLVHAIDLVDVAIGQIRTAVLALTPDPTGESLRHRILDIVRDLAVPFGTTPLLQFDGPVDLIERGALSEDMVAVVREALTNAAKHAAADHVGVTVRAKDDFIEILVWDDGVGLPEHPVRSGLANLANRALARNGTFSIVSDAPGTRAVWRVPAEIRAAA